MTKTGFFPSPIDIASDAACKPAGAATLKGH